MSAARASPIAAGHIAENAQHVIWPTAGARLTNHGDGPLSDIRHRWPP